MSIPVEGMDERVANELLDWTAQFVRDRVGEAVSHSGMAGDAFEPGERKCLGGGFALGVGDAGEAKDVQVGCRVAVGGS